MIVKRLPGSGGRFSLLLFCLRLVVIGSYLFSFGGMYVSDDAGTIVFKDAPGKYAGNAGKENDKRKSGVFFDESQHHTSYWCDARECHGKVAHDPSSFVFIRQGLEERVDRSYGDNDGEACRNTDDCRQPWDVDKRE